jgi:hypothetical protein
MAKKNTDRTLPCIGIWTLTKTSLPTAGNTLVGLWQDKATDTIGFFCAFYRDEKGECVDPNEEGWDHVTYHCRQGDSAILHDEEIDPPDYWAEARWLIPGWGR